VSTSLPGFESPAASTEVPLEMLAACHGRIEAQCAGLRRLLRHLPLHGADEPARQAAVALMRYFDIAAPQHHEDEEADLFPALIEAMAGSDAVCLRELTESLVREHRTLEAAWRLLRRMLEGVARGDALALEAGRAEEFAQACERHLAREDAELLPMAARLLDDAALTRIGEAMRVRRGITALD